MARTWKSKEVIFLVAVCIFITVVFAGCNLLESNEITVEEVDLDLAALGPLMAYATIKNISLTPEDHLGTTIRVMGSYFNFFSPDIEEYVHFIFVDEGECCEQGFEIRMEDGWGNPEEFIDLGTKIEVVVGVYSVSEENGRKSFYLSVTPDYLVVNPMSY